MKLYDVTEIVVYRVLARSADEAEKIVINSRDRDKYVIDVKDRYAELAAGATLAGE